MYDVIVIGAGPAGNIAARKLSSLGRRVLVLDSRINIGDKLCTGIVGRECVDRYPPDPAHIFGEARSATVVAPSGKSYQIANAQPQGYIIDRVAFVASLAKDAEESGADYLLGPRVIDISVSHRDVTVLTRGEGGRQVHTGQILILASGFGSPLLRLVNLRSPPGGAFMVGTQAEVIADGLEDPKVYLGDSISPGCFGWLVPLSGSRALIGLVSRVQLNGQLRDFTDRLKSTGKVNEIITKPRRWGIPLKPIPKTYGERVMVVGDSAGLVKPTTGGGIYYALLSGEIAAETAHEALNAGDLSARRLKSYQDRWKATFGRELRVGYFARRLFEVLGDQQIEGLVDEFLSVDVQQELINSPDFSFDWHSTTILKVVRHRAMGRLIRSFGPAVIPYLSRLATLRA